MLCGGMLISLMLYRPLIMSTVGDMISGNPEAMTTHSATKTRAHCLQEN